MTVQIHPFFTAKYTVLRIVRRQINLILFKSLTVSNCFPKLSLLKYPLATIPHDIPAVLSI
ncbi:MAG: hypothetical protein H6Q68_1860 [Firmicutes bacterium]|nr:hypothetical protein [Bacillota bacterium]